MSKKRMTLELSGAEERKFEECRTWSGADTYAMGVRWGIRLFWDLLAARRRGYRILALGERAALDALDAGAREVHVPVIPGLTIPSAVDVGVVDPATFDEGQQAALVAAFDRIAARSPSEGST